MAYCINIDISHIGEDVYQSLLTTFINTYPTNTYQDKYHTKYQIDSEADLDTTVYKLLEEYEWALFTYFTTYHSHYVTFITYDKKTFDNYLKSMNAIQNEHIQLYPNKNTTAKDFKHLTFDDYNNEGEYALRLSIEEDKQNPYLICCINSAEEYRCYNYEKDNFDEDIWYEKHINSLKEIKRFSRSFTSPTFDENDKLIKKEYIEEYIIYEIADEYAYLSIWEMASEDVSIAGYTISAHSNLNVVEKIITEHPYDSFTYLTNNQNIPWIYSLIYGGGSDEHHAIFFANDVKYVNRLSEYVSESFWSRF